MFQPDIPGAIVVPAHEHNIRPGVNHPKVLVLHTPEEEADAIEVTPNYFARSLLPRRASTHYYASGGVGTWGDGALYQMVPENQGAIANGVTTQAYLNSIGRGNLLGKEYPAGTDPTVSLNLQSLSIETEGRAITIHRTMPRGSLQWRTVVKWVAECARRHEIPLDRAHVIGHYDVSVYRTDPGTLDLHKIIEDAREELDMAQLWLLKKKGTEYTFITDGLFRSHVKSATALKELQDAGVWPREIIEVSGSALDQIPKV